MQEFDTRLGNSLVFHYNINANGEYTTVKIDETKQISPLHYTIQLSQNPDDSKVFKVIDKNKNELHRVYNMDEINAESYYLNAEKGQVYFDSSKGAENVIISYDGQGYELIGASRVYDETDCIGNTIKQTLQDIINKGRDYIKAIELLGGAIPVITRLENDIADGMELYANLENDIEIAVPLQSSLHKDIQDANTFRIQFNKDVAEGKELYPKLHSDIAEGKELDNTLNTSMNNAKESINLIRSAENPHFDILASDWIVNTDTSSTLGYMKDITHNLETQNIIINAFDITTGMEIFPNVRRINNNTLRFFNDNNIDGIKIILSARYYDGGSDIGDEVKGARKTFETIGKRFDNIDSHLAEIPNQIYINDKATKSEVDVERKRIDGFTKLSEGSTTGDAELIDGRIGSDGKTYDNIGGAIRGQVNQMKDNLDNLKITSMNIISSQKFESGKFYGNTIGIHTINDIFDTTSGNNIFGVYKVADGQILQISKHQNVDMTIKLYDINGILRAIKTNILRYDTPLICAVEGFSIGYFSVTSTQSKGAITICIGDGTLTDEYLDFAMNGFVKQEKEYNNKILQDEIDVLKNEVDKINAVKTVFVNPSDGIEGINTAIVNMPSYGGTIILGNGTYTNISGTSSVVFYNKFARNNIRIVGQGYGTVINRSTGINDVIANQESIQNNIIENVHFANSVQRTVKRPEKALRFISCWVKDKYINETEEPKTNVMTVGVGKEFEKLSDALSVHYENQLLYNLSDRWEIHVYGHIIETTSVFFSRDYIDIIGHNAIIEIKGKKDAYFKFVTDVSGYDYGDAKTNMNVKDVHFLKTGCYNYWDNPAVDVQSNNVKFYNCIFENRTSSPSPFNQANWSPGSEDTNGSRRHGITISCSSYGENCNTAFYNCIGIGSPYGFQNTRGFYILYGSPKLYNCIGFGGGIGEYGHGILSHRGSQAELIGCIGYASKTAYRNASGIRFQAHGMSSMRSCIGYASIGEKWVSDGVSASRITEICNDLGISSLPYIVDGVVQYNVLTDTICEKIKNNDIILRAVGENTESGYGISFWANNGSSKLLNCEGYSGSGDNSNGLHIIGNASPLIIGGYFGKRDMVLSIPLTQSGTYPIRNYSELNQYSEIRINKITLTISAKALTNIDSFVYIVTDEVVPQTIVDGYNIKNISSIAMLPCASVKLPTNASLRVYIIQNGENIPISDNMYKIDVQYNLSGENCSALLIGESASPEIIGAVIKADIDNKAIESSISNNRIFDCELSGIVDSSLTFENKTYANNSTNYIL